MNDVTRILDTDEAWEEGALGREEAFAQAAEESLELAIDDALGLQPISIRLERSLIEDFKMIASLNSLGYQTLMRQALKRFAECEKKRILRDLVAQHAEDEAHSRAGSNKKTQPKVKKAA